MYCFTARSILIATTLLGAPLVQGQNVNSREENRREFAGINFGVGLGVTLDTGTRDRVDAATIDANGIVRVNESSNIRARVFLETHKFIYSRSAEGGKSFVPHGIGPFIALQPGTDEIIESIGIGILFGWRHDDETTESFNLGVAIHVDPRTQVLGDEFRKNQPAPLDAATGEPLGMRFVDRDQGAVLIFASFSW